MSNPELPKRGLKQIGVVSRKAIGPSQELTRASYLRPGQPLPLVIQPAVKGVDLVEWARSNRDYIETQVLSHGGILFRDFDVPSIDTFELFIAAASDEAIEYRERSSPRSQVSGNIYTSTDHPPDQTIFLHNEHSYSRTFPLRIFFCCMTAAQQGGETPIADCRKVWQHIDPAIQQRFTERKWMYVRNFGEGFGLPWPTVFQTPDRSAVERYCAENKIEVEWKDGDRLRTRQVRPAVARHPRSGELTWFNHATFFHISTLPPVIRGALESAFQTEDLPNNTYYGDGWPIEPEVMEHLRHAYLQEQVVFPWQQGDILMLDNMLTAHARMPFVGPRKVVVGMSQPFMREDL